MQKWITFVAIGGLPYDHLDRDRTGKSHVSQGRAAYLGIRPGEKIELNKLPEGRITLRAAKPSGTFDGFLGLLAGKTKKTATLDEINEAAASGWAGKE